MSLLRPTLQTVLLPSAAKAANIFSPAKGVATTAATNSFFKKNDDKTTAYSALLSDEMAVYEVDIEDVKPKEWQSYLKHKAAFLEMAKNRPGLKRELVASWKFIYGDVNFRAMHLFKYPQGWTDIDAQRLAVNADTEYLKERDAGYALILRQESEFLKSFSFWPSPSPRTGNHVYDVRSYSIKPGGMYDWANYWSKGLRLRQNVRSDIPFAGFFTQLGRVHTIYHIWCYNDLADRKQCRERTWDRDGWNDVVANTVPLVRSMKTRILEPLEFSPTK